MAVFDLLWTFPAVLIQETQSQPVDDSGVKIVAGALAVVLVAIIILRRKRKSKTEDEF